MAQNEWRNIQRNDDKKLKPNGNPRWSLFLRSFWSTNCCEDKQNMSVCSLRAISQFYKVHHHPAKKRDVFELFSPVLTKTLKRSIDGNAIASFTEHAQY